MKSTIVLLVSLALALPAIGLADTTTAPPFGALQRQIDQVNSKLNTLLGQKCSDGGFLTGFTATGEVICGNIQPPAPQQTTYTMACDRCDNDVGLCGNDPFNAQHGNYTLEFQSGFAGSIAAVGVEISTAGGTSARLELKDVSSGNILAVSEAVSTSSTGWVEFKFSPAYVIDRSSIILNFVADIQEARIYNCANTVAFTPAGLTAYGLGLEGHLARSYIKINN